MFAKLWRSLKECYWTKVVRIRIRNDTCQWIHINNLLKASRFVYTGLIGASPRLPIQVEALDYFVENFEQAESVFVYSTESPSPVVAAYCLSWLSRFKSARVLEISESVKNRKELIVTKGGCFIVQCQLGEWATQLIENFRAENEIASATSSGDCNSKV